MTHNPLLALLQPLPLSLSDLESAQPDSFLVLPSY